MASTVLSRLNFLFRHYVVRKGRFRLYLAYSKFAVWIPEAYPDFFCIGAPRAATTWLHKRLTLHPDVFLPRVKEVHFFSEPMDVAPPHSPVRPVPNRIFFDMDSPAHWRWYFLHFLGAEGRIKGDVTPLYSIISGERIRLVADRMPRLKLIYILRNPVERAWSDACRPFQYKSEKFLRNHETIEKIRNNVFHPIVLKLGEYHRIIDSWEAAFGADRILYLFFDDIISRPREQLVKVCRHLDISPDGLPSEEHDRKRENVAPKFEMPRDVRGALSKHYAEQRPFLEKKFKRNFDDWF